MTIVKHELRQTRISFLVWTAAIAFFLAVCVFIYPDMKGQMEEFGYVFSDMGTLTTAFGMDRLNFGTLLGFYSIECGNVLGIGGALFASLTGANMLSKEEKDHTAEFLLSHPCSRTRVVTEKLIALFIELVLMNLIIYAVCVISISAIGEEIPWTEINLLHLAYLLLQVELASLCFGISAFVTQGSAGAGIGIAVMMYFVNLIANVSESMEFLKKVTPFAYCEAADIIESGSLDTELLLIGAAVTVISILAAYLRYTRKDIHC